MAIKEFLTGNTQKVSWISSGETATSIHYAVRDGSETLVDSATMTDSGNGHYYGLHTVPDTPGYYVVETTATINGRPYKNRERYRAIELEVD